MRMRFAITLMLLQHASTATAAQICGIAELQERMETSAGLTWQFSDVPVPHVPRTWITGEVNGRQLTLLSSRNATLSEQSADWAVELKCEPDAESCEQHLSGDVPADAIATSDILQGCMLGQPIEPDLEEAPPADPIEPEAPNLTTIATVESVLDLTASSQRPAPPASCDKPTYEGMDKGLALQSLLIGLGAEIKPDGIVGPKTRAAAASYLQDGDATGAADVIFNVLQSQTCEREDGSLELRSTQQN